MRVVSLVIYGRDYSANNMATLTQSQLDALRNKGLSDDKIQAIATQRGFDMPKESFVKSLVKSEVRFGQSIAGAVGSIAPNLAGKKTVDEANRLSEQVKANTLRAIQEKRARGEDTTRLITALRAIDSEVNFYDILNSSTGGSLDKSARQVLGEGLGVAADVVGAGALPGGIGQIAKAGSLGQGIKAGFKAGAVGGSLFGGVAGASQAAQENKTGGEIVGSGIRGGVAGGVVGGVAGGALGGVAGGVAGRAQKIANKDQQFVLDLVSPKATEKVKIQAYREGRVTEQGLLRGAKILPSKRDRQVAEAVAGVVSRKKSTLQNFSAIESKVDEINTGVKAFVRANKVPFNTNQLKSQLNAGRDELQLIFASDATAERTYNAVVDEFLKHVKTKDTAGLLEARQVVDKIPAIKKLLDSRAMGENVKREIVLTVRGQANRYIAQLLPKGNKYREALLQESRMIEALGNLAEKGTITIGKNKLQMAARKYPILKLLIGSAVVGTTGAVGVGVGGSVIGSLD